MKTIILILTLTIFNQCFSQGVDTTYSYNTDLTYKLLDTLNYQIDPDVKLLSIDGKIFSDIRFKEFARREQIPFIFVGGCDTDAKIETVTKSVLIEVTSSIPFLATVQFCNCKFDCSIGSFEITAISGQNDYKLQKWAYDIGTRKFIRAE